MKKRLLALSLVFVMLLAMVPAAQAATPTDITNTGLAIWTGQNGGDGPTLSGTYQAGDGTLEWDLDTLTITLTNATINATNAQYGNALEILMPSTGYPEVKMVLNGTNTITGKDYLNSHGILSHVPLRISGNGTLTVTGGTASSGESAGIDCFGLTVEQGATVNASGGSATVHSYGVSSSAEVTVAGNLKAVTGDGNQSFGMLVNRGLVVEESGTLEARGALTYKTASYGIAFNGSDMPVTVNGTLIAIGFAPFGNKNAVYQNKVIIKGSYSESGTDLVSFSPSTTSFSADSYANNPKEALI